MNRPSDCDHRKTAKVPDGSGKKLPFAGTGQIYFLGLLHGHWDVPKTLDKITQAEAVNMGVSIVVPAHKIWEVLNRPELEEERRLQDEMIGKEKLRTEGDSKVQRLL
jgi:hypothetical protein